jgi:hypothetical protein
VWKKPQSWLWHGKKTGANFSCNRGRWFQFPARTRGPKVGGDSSEEQTSADVNAEHWSRIKGGNPTRTPLVTKASPRHSRNEVLRHLRRAVVGATLNPAGLRFRQSRRHRLLGVRQVGPTRQR